MPYDGYEPWLSLDFGDDAARHVEAYIARREGYSGARKAVTALSSDEVIEQTRASGLRGRGGAGFSTGVKWNFVPKGGDKPTYVVANADESEPGTFKDRALMTYSPHLLIEGMIIASKAINCHAAYVYIRGEYVRVAEILIEAVGEAYEKGYLGKGIFGSDYDLDITVHRGAGAYICGEETGMLSSLEGQRGYPKIKPPFPAVEGAFRCPTVVNNVETLANLPFIFSRGVEAYKAIGPEGSPGHKLFCLSGHVNKPGLYEAPMTVTLKELIYHDAFGGGISDGRELKAVIPGGLSFPLFTRAQLDEEDVQMDFDTVRARGSFLGSAGVIVMHDGVSIPDALYNVVRFYHHESCGQCTPCREGTGWAKKILHRMVKEKKGGPEDVDLLLSLADQMTGTTICLLADSCAMPIRSYVNAFREEFEHLCKERKPQVEEAVPL